MRQAHRSVIAAVSPVILVGVVAVALIGSRCSESSEEWAARRLKEEAAKMPFVLKYEPSRCEGCGEPANLAVQWYDGETRFFCPKHGGTDDGE